ncbi:hypothetical protein D9M68_745250 [compost metagenome]
MTGQYVVVAQAEVLLEITLLHPVQVGANCPALAHRTVQQLAAHAGVHGFQVATVGHAVEVLVQLARLVQLEHRHGHVRGGHVLADEGAYPWQVTGRVVLELVEVVHQVPAEHAVPPEVALEAVLGSQVGGELVEDEAVGAADVLLVAQAQAVAEGR